MSGYDPYEGYEPNEPTVPEGRPRPLSPAGPMRESPARKPDAQVSARYVWDESQFQPNEPEPAAHAGSAAGRTEPEPWVRHSARAENPYARPTWDETEYDPQPAPEGGETGAWSDETAYAEDFDAAETDGESVGAREASAASGSAGRVNPYARPAPSEADRVSDLSARFAPPLKFELPKTTHAQPADMAYMGSPAEPNVYRTRKPVARDGSGAGADPASRGGDYRVEADGLSPARRKQRRRRARRWIIALVLLAALGAAAYLNRAWLLAQLKPLLGEEAIQTVNQAIEGTQIASVAGYDPAPTLQVGAPAKKGISAVAGGIGLETYAVTASNVIARVPLGDGRYDVYLFAAADGQLLGYYENLGENDFLVCAGDAYYVAEPPYLINAQGKPLISETRLKQVAGADAKLWPLTNGWALIRKADGSASNYVNADGNLLSTLWFARAYPFTASSTLAYVDTGNVTDPEERYTLYELTRSGEMKLWKHTADMDGVLGCAAGVACLSTGELIRLDGKQTALCTTDEATVYADCGAVVARDPQTGKYGLFVNGEQQYDFAYDSIAPVPSDIQWQSVQNGLYTLNTITGVAYPLPLSHYFALKKGSAQELVALSTGSVYPLLLND